jgi:hypothetical protein
MEMGDAVRFDRMRGRGYVSSTKGGSERLTFTPFYKALLVANSYPALVDLTPGTEFEIRIGR